MENQKSIYGKGVVNQDILIIKYDGPSFDNRMELHTFTKQITAIEKVLRQTVDTLNKNRKIKDSSRDSRYFLELRRGSFETVLVILFSNPILVNVVSDCIFEYLKYLASLVKSEKYDGEIKTLIEDKSIRRATKDIINPCISDADKITIINGDVHNIFIIDSEKRKQIEETLYQVENEIPVEEFEQELIGYILKVDAVKAQEHLNRSKLGFVIEGQFQAIETGFDLEISEEEIRKLLFSRIKIKAVAFYKSDDIFRLLIKSYEFAPKKKLEHYFK